jgi:hypothetical protein
VRIPAEPIHFQPARAVGDDLAASNGSDLMPVRLRNCRSHCLKVARCGQQGRTMRGERPGAADVIAVMVTDDHVAKRFASPAPRDR